MNILFENVLDIRRVDPSLESNTTFENIQPYLAQGTEQFIYPYISQEFYEELQTSLEGENFDLEQPALAGIKSVLEYLRKAQWYYGLYLSLPGALSSITGRGARELTEQGSTQPRQWVYHATSEQAINQADTYVDLVLSILEKAPGSYPTWQSSSAFTIHHRFLVKSASDFPDIAESRRTYVSLLQYIEQTEDKYIEASVGPDLMATLKGKQQTATVFTTHEARLVELLKKAIANYALYLSANSLRLRATDKGVMVSSTDDGIRSNAMADDTKVSMWMKNKKENADYYLNRAKNYLEINASEFPDYDGSDYQENKQPSTVVSDHIQSSGGNVII